MSNSMVNLANQLREATVAFWACTSEGQMNRGPYVPEDPLAGGDQDVDIEIAEGEVDFELTESEVDVDAEAVEGEMVCDAYDDSYKALVTLSDADGKCIATDLDIKKNGDALGLIGVCKYPVSRIFKCDISSDDPTNIACDFFGDPIAENYETGQAFHPVGLIESAEYYIIPMCLEDVETGEHKKCTLFFLNKDDGERVIHKDLSVEAEEDGGVITKHPKLVAADISERSEEYGERLILAGSEGGIYMSSIQFDGVGEFSQIGSMDRTPLAIGKFEPIVGEEAEQIAIFGSDALGTEVAVVAGLQTAMPCLESSYFDNHKQLVSFPELQLETMNFCDKPVSFKKGDPDSRVDSVRAIVASTIDSVGVAGNNFIAPPVPNVISCNPADGDFDSDVAGGPNDVCQIPMPGCNVYAQGAGMLHPGYDVSAYDGFIYTLGLKSRGGNEMVAMTARDFLYGSNVLIHQELGMNEISASAVYYDKNEGEPVFYISVGKDLCDDTPTIVTFRPTDDGLCSATRPSD